MNPKLKSCGRCKPESPNWSDPPTFLYSATTCQWIMKPCTPVLRWWDMILEPTRQKQTSGAYTAQKPPQASATLGLGGRTVVCSKGSCASQIIHVGVALVIRRVEKIVCSLPRGDSDPGRNWSMAAFSSIGESSRDMFSASTKIEKIIFSVTKHLQQTVPHAWVRKPQGSLTSLL